MSAKTPSATSLLVPLPKEGQFICFAVIGRADPARTVGAVASLRTLRSLRSLRTIFWGEPVFAPTCALRFFGDSRDSKDLFADSSQKKAC